MLHRSSSDPGVGLSDAMNIICYVIKGLMQSLMPDFTDEYDPLSR